MTDAEILSFCKDRNVEIYTRYEAATESLLIRLRRGNYAIDRRISGEDVFQSAFGMTIRVTLRQMAAALDDMEEKK